MHTSVCVCVCEYRMLCSVATLQLSRSGVCECDKEDNWQVNGPAGDSSIKVNLIITNISAECRTTVGWLT